MKKVKYLSLILLSFFISSCCKDAGEGGEASLVVYLKHHEKVISSHADSIAGYPQGYWNTVYIKYDAEESPGTSASSYDKLITGSGHTDHIHIEGLKCGKYFIYGVGYDKDILQEVRGGVAIKIRYKERKQEVTVDVPVTE
jgi:hypothetical protein